MSSAAEQLLGVTEGEVVHRRVTDLLLPADCEASGADHLIHLLLGAARGEAPTGDMVVRPAREFGIRYCARIGSCGPPKAAVLVLGDGLR